MGKTWILKIPVNGIDFRPLTIFQTETEAWMWYEDVPWATDNASIFSHCTVKADQVKATLRFDLLFYLVV